MEQYKLQEHLGQSTWVVQENESGRQYVLKKIECLDEIEANYIFEKMCPLLTLSHNLLIPYHHMFVSWDTDRAVCLSIVSKYIPKGNLEIYLTSLRAAQQWVEETLAKRWIGQLTESMVTLHRHQILHKNLKTANIYLSEDDSLLIGDIGVPFESSMALTASHWSPPEDQSFFDERSDMWSVGCVILEMCTTGCLTDSEFFASLYQLKTEPEVLIKLLSKVSHIYGEETADLIRSLIRQNHHQRPMAIELCDKPFIVDCLSLSESLLLNELNNPRDKQDDIYFKLMKSKYSVDAQLVLLQELVDHVESCGTYFTLRESFMKMLLANIDQHMKCPELVTKCFLILYYGYDDKPVQGSGKETNVVKLISEALKIHFADIKLVHSALRLLLLFSSKDVLLNDQAVTTSLKVMRKFSDAPDLLVLTCGLLINLTKQRTALNAAVSQGLVPLVCRALRDHPDSCPLVGGALSLLWAATCSDDALLEMCTCNANLHISRAFQKHGKEPEIVKFGLGILATMCEIKDDIAYLLADVSSNPTPLIVIVENTKLHLHNAPVVHQYIHLLKLLTIHEQIKEELYHVGVTESLTECIKNYAPIDDYYKSLKDEIQLLLLKLAS